MFGKSKTEEEEILEVCRDIKNTLDNQIKNSPEYSTKLTIKEAFHFSLKSWEYELDKTKFHADALFASSLLVGLIFVLYILHADRGNKVIVGFLACLGDYLATLFFLNMYKYMSLHRLFEEKKKEFLDRSSLYFNVVNESVNMMKRYDVPKKKICSISDFLNKITCCAYVPCYYMAILFLIIQIYGWLDFPLAFLYITAILPVVFIAYCFKDLKDIVWRNG